jgi:hypothetical protein
VHAFPEVSVKVLKHAKELEEVEDLKDIWE